MWALVSKLHLRYMKRAHMLYLLAEIGKKQKIPIQKMQSQYGRGTLETGVLDLSDIKILIYDKF